MFKRGNFDKQIGKLPKKVEWCKICTMSNQRPRIKFDKGICSACKNLNYKNKQVDWTLREKELIELLKSHRRNDGSWDVIVPSSGGKDSGYVAHTLKYKYNMNPLLITWSPLRYTNIGFENFTGLNDSGLVNLKCSQNGLINRKLARLCFEEFGDAFHAFVLGQVYFPMHMAIKFNIKLIFYGENGELEYAGDPGQVDKPYNDFLTNEAWLNGYLKGTSLNDLLNYAKKTKDYIKDMDINSPDLNFYNPPPVESMKELGISRHYYFSYYKKWIPQENFYYCADNTNFKPNPERTEGTYSKYASIDDKFDGMHYYMRYIKFGLGRCVEDAAHEIRDGHITREEAIGLIKQFEGEFPKKYFKEFLEYLQIKEDYFWEIVDSWRLKHLWKKKSGTWQLRKPVF